MQAMTAAAEALAHNTLDAVPIDRPPGAFL